MRAILALLLIALPLGAAKKPTPTQLTAQLRQLTEERDDLKQRLAAAENLQQELVAARKARDLARQESEAARREAEHTKAALKENQGSGDSILKELQEARQAASEAKSETLRLRGENEELQRRTSAAPLEGDLRVLGEDLLPARPINLNRMVPRLKASGLFTSRPKGVVVVNVLISEKGDVLAARLLQGLPAETPDGKAAEGACIEAAKRLVFDPATSADGKVHFKVWQGVGFHLE